MIRSLAGVLATRALRLLASLPPGILSALGNPLLPLYCKTQGELHRKLATMGLPSAFSAFSPRSYYRMRLRLVAHSLRHLTGRKEDFPIRVEGREHFQKALQTGKCIALLGWHQGPVELLHHIPHLQCEGRPFFLLASAGFSPALSGFLEKGRRGIGKHLLEPGEMGLRRWVRENGILAVMADQVPGKPESRFPLWNGKCQIPKPRRLFEFMESHDAIPIPVSVRLGAQRIDFQYHPPLNTGNLAEEFQLRLEKSISEYPDQYNWSYPKIRIK